MDSNNVILAMSTSQKTVFSLQSLMMLTGNFDKRSLVKSLYYYRKKGLILSPRSGIYTKLKYNPEELACSVFSNSYISLQYVLAKAGVIFQYSETITCVSEVSRNVSIDGRIYQFRRISPEIWGGMRGITQFTGYVMATPERAFLDMLYLFPDIGFIDNPNILDKDRIFEYVEDYKNISLLNRVKRIYG